MKESISASVPDVDSLLEDSNEALQQAGSPFEIYIFSDEDDDDCPYVVTLGRRDKDPFDSWDEITGAEDLAEVRDVIRRWTEIYLEEANSL